MAAYNRWMNERLYALCAELRRERQRTALLMQSGRDPGLTDLIGFPGLESASGARGAA